MFRVARRASFLQAPPQRVNGINIVRVGPPAIQPASTKATFEHKTELLRIMGKSGHEVALSTRVSRLVAVSKMHPRTAGELPASVQFRWLSGVYAFEEKAQALTPQLLPESTQALKQESSKPQEPFSFSALLPGP